jgi:hypothetical protein
MEQQVSNHDKWYAKHAPSPFPKGHRDIVAHGDWWPTVNQSCRDPKGVDQPWSAAILYIYIYIYIVYIYIYLVGGLEHCFYMFLRLSIYWNVIIPTDELIFFRGVETTNQSTSICKCRYLSKYIYIYILSSIGIHSFGHNCLKPLNTWSGFCTAWLFCCQ